MEDGCVFCELDYEDIILENDNVIAIFDKYPVSEGHMLIIPKYHNEKYFNSYIRSDLWGLVDKCKEYLDEKYKPDGYNIGMNLGESAGQTINHLHIHLIPRYEGDLDNPEGGVRGVIPEKRMYRDKISLKKGNNN